MRWCPGCGDYAILAAVQGFLPELGLRRENIVFVSGIGCSVAVPVLPGHLRHALDPRPRARRSPPASPTSRPDLSVWVVTGDGDALSIGGNHLIHALRRNVNLKILLFNNRIYGLTKGQYSPTSEVGKITKSTPMGSLDHPFNPVSLALGAEATLRGPHHRLRPQAPHRGAAARRPRTAGTALVEIYQNCPIFNDGAFDALKDRDEAAGPADPARARRADPVRRPARSVRPRPTARLGVVEVVDGADPARSPVVHDAHADGPVDGVRAVPARRPDAGARRRSASSARSSGRRTTTWCARRSTAPSRARRRATPTTTTWPGCCR